MEKPKPNLCHNTVADRIVYLGIVNVKWSGCKLSPTLNATRYHVTVCRVPVYKPILTFNYTKYILILN